MLRFGPSPDLFALFYVSASVFHMNLSNYTVMIQTLIICELHFGTSVTIGLPPPIKPDCPHSNVLSGRKGEKREQQQQHM